jgi:hypothetical protein
MFAASSSLAPTLGGRSGVAVVPDGLTAVFLLVCGVVGLVCVFHDAHNESNNDPSDKASSVDSIADDDVSDVAPMLPAAMLSAVALVVGLCVAAVWRETWTTTPELLLGDSWRGIGLTLQAYNAALSELVALPVTSPIPEGAATCVSDAIMWVMLAGFSAVALACALVDIADAADEEDKEEAEESGSVTAAPTETLDAPAWLDEKSMLPSAAVAAVLAVVLVSFPGREGVGRMLALVAVVFGTVAELSRRRSGVSSEKMAACEKLVSAKAMSRAVLGTALAAVFLALFCADAASP